MKKIHIISIIFLIIFTMTALASKPDQHSTKPITEPVAWKLSKLTGKPSDGIILKGQPLTVKCKYGKAVSFNGSTDAIFIDSNPINGLNQFTVELIFQPASGGNFEQRFVHMGEIQGSRLLLELRATKTDWYFDAFVKSGDQQVTLIKPELLHPLDKWYHIACVMNNGKFETYINGIKELEGKINFTPLGEGKTSVGVRQNEVSWFKGNIYMIRITPKALDQKDFLKYQ